MKKILKLVGIVVCGAMIAGCGKETDDSNKETEEVKEENEISEVTQETEENMEKGELAGGRLAFVAKNTDTEYWKIAKKGIQKAIDDVNEKLGYEGEDKITITFEGPKNETDVNQQINILDAILSENPLAVCLAAVDMDSCRPQLETAQENKIPIVLFDSGLSDSESVYAMCSTDNKAAGAEAARRLSQAIGEEGQIAILSHGQLGESSQQRIQGFEEEIQEQHPQESIVQISYEPSKEGEVSLEEQVEAVLAQYPDLKGYFSTNEVTGASLLTVLGKHPDRDIKVVSFDMGKVQEQAIRDNKLVGVISQNSYQMGYQTAIAGIKAALHMENEQWIPVEYRWIDGTNLDMEENKEYIY